ncbi:hypothetical protein GDP17_04425 [Gordonia jinghuaiqii]|nr:hypothetical protein [Gordonia jinghuaiqii]
MRHDRACRRPSCPRSVRQPGVGVRPRSGDAPAAHPGRRAGPDVRHRNRRRLPPQRHRPRRSSGGSGS